MRIWLSGNESEINTFVEHLKSDNSLVLNSVSLPYYNNCKVAYSTDVRVYVDVSFKPVVSSDLTCVKN